jgi:hypothetical protein
MLHIYKFLWFSYYVLRRLRVNTAAFVAKLSLVPGVESAALTDPWAGQCCASTPITHSIKNGKVECFVKY